MNRLRSAILGVISAFGLVTPALAQTALTRAQNETNINATIKSNGIGAITAPILNTILNNLAASMATTLDPNIFSQSISAANLPPFALNINSTFNGIDYTGCTASVSCTFYINGAPALGGSFGANPTVRIDRSPTGTGGINGDDVFGLEVVDNAAATNSWTENAGFFILNNRAPIANGTESAALLAQAFKQGNVQVGATWAASFYAWDSTGVAPTSGQGLIGNEIGLAFGVPGAEVNAGTDPFVTRQILKLVCSGASGTHCGQGESISAFFAGDIIDTGLCFGTGCNGGNGTFGVGINMTGAFSESAILFSALNQNGLGWTNTSGVYTPTSAGTQIYSDTSNNLDINNYNGTQTNFAFGSSVVASMTSAGMALSGVAGGSTPTLNVTTANHSAFSVVGAQIIANVDYGSFGDANTTFGLVVGGGKNLDTGATTGSWQLFSARYTGFGGGDGSAFITAGQELMSPTAGSNNNSGRFFGNNPECIIPTGMTPAECTGEEIDIKTLSSPTSDRHGLRIVDIGSTGSHATDDSGLSIVSSGIGWTTGLEFGSQSGQFPVVAGGTIISAVSSTVALNAGIYLQPLTGTPTLAWLALPPNTRGLCFGSGSCNAGSIVSTATANGGSLVFGSNNVSINFASAELTVSSTGGVAMPNLPTSAGSGGIVVCVDTSGNLYKKSTCP